MTEYKQALQDFEAGKRISDEIILKSLRLSVSIEEFITIPDNSENDKIGYVTKSGLVYCGQNSKGQFLYTTKENLDVMDWNKAVKEIEKINKKGTYKEFGEARFPTGWRSETNELFNVLYKNKDAIGGFITSDSSAARRVWGPESNGNLAQVQWFDDGSNYNFTESGEAALRPVWSLNHLVI